MPKTKQNTSNKSRLKWFTFIMPDGCKNTFQASDVNVAKRMAYRCIERTRREEARLSAMLEATRNKLKMWKQQYLEAHPAAPVIENMEDLCEEFKVDRVEPTKRGKDDPKPASRVRRRSNPPADSPTFLDLLEM